MEDRRCVHPLTHIACVPMTQCRSHSHVKNMFIARVAHARDWSAFTSAASADMLEGFQPHEPTRVHERMARKCDIWPHMTPLHTAHTHITTHQSHRTTLQHCCAADGKNFSCKTTVALATQTTSRAPDENMSEALPSDFPPMRWRLHHLCCCRIGGSR